MATEVADLFAKFGLKIEESTWKRGEQILGFAKQALVGITSVVGDVADLGGHIHDLSDKTGISVESLQELQFGAKLAGVDLETLTNSLGKLGKGLTDNVAAGKGPTLDALKSIGINVQDVKDKLSGEGGFDDILGTVADKFAAMEPGVKKNALAMELFGKSGGDLIPLLNVGAKGIDDLRARANELGVVMSTESINVLDDFGDSTDEAKMAWQGMKNTIVTAVLPILTPAIKGLTNAIANASKFLRAHSTDIMNVLGGVGAAIKAVFLFVVDVVETVLDVLKAIGEGFIWFGKRVVDAFDFITGMARSIVAFMLRIGSFLRAIGDRLWSIFRFMSDRFRDAWSAISDTAAHVRDVLLDIGGRIRDAFAGAATAIKEAFEAAFKIIMEKAEAVAKFVKDKTPIGKAGTAIGEGLAKGALAARGLLSNQSELKTAELDTIEAAAEAAGVSPEEFIRQRNANAAKFRTGAATAPGAGAAGASISTTQVNVGGITVNAAPGMDEHELAKQVDKRLQDHVTNAAED